MMARRAIYQMLESTGCGLDCARAIRVFQGWTCDDETARKRLMQCLNGTAGRHFEIDWYPIVLRVVIAHGGEDLVEPLFAEARYQARRESELLEQHGRRGPIRSPAPTRKQGMVA